MSLWKIVLARINNERLTVWKSYIWACAVPVLVSAACFPLLNVLDIANIVMLFLLEVFLCALWLGKRASLIAAILSVLLFDLIFVPPRFALVTSTLEHLITLAVMLLVAVVTGQLTATILAQNRALTVSEEQASALYQMARELAGAVDREQVEAIAKQYPNNDATISLLSIARERIRFAEMAQMHSIQMESERLRSSILSSLSHDLRTPLTALVGLTETLNHQAEKHHLSAIQRESMEAIHEQAVRLAEMVAKLLDLARLSAGTVRLNKEWQPIDDVIATSRQLLSLALADYQVRVTIPPHFPLLSFDAVLIERVIGNLLENATKYTPKGSAIVIEVQQWDAYAKVCIHDGGSGFPSAIVMANQQAVMYHEMMPRLGSGLGLAICEAILKAHDGQLFLTQDVQTQGGCACFTLPLGTPPTMDDEVDDAELGEGIL